MANVTHGTIPIVLEDYKNAPDGSLLIKRGGKWVTTNFEELNKEYAKKLTELEKLKGDFKILAENNKHFTKYAKSHFMLVFNSFKQGYLNGEIDIEDETILDLDKLVLNGTLSVKEAIERHPYLKETFEKVFLSDGDLIAFPQV